ncbi:MAG: Rne/Rng family ribonuclease, partial [Endozoicomonadaceae bacterium]|nr:Rne/Rng family ribonuclease [Endozoicomonadaceae bacterium]
MNEEILVNVTEMESRVALVDHGILQEVYIERHNKRGLVGNIYKGRVVKIMPGMQAAFIDIGLERTAFIHERDVAKLDWRHESNIAQLFHEGQDLLVQVTKDPIGSKGAKLTTNIALPARYLVFMPRSNHLGVSLKINLKEERERLRHLLVQLLEMEKFNHATGFIIRTAAESVNNVDLQMDLKFLIELWYAIFEQSQKCQAPICVYEDLSLSLRMIRDLPSKSTNRILIDCLKTYQKSDKFVRKLVPHLIGKVHLYTDSRPLFDLYSIDEDINLSLDRKVQLKSGGYLMIDQTEALTTIDVNTGTFIGHRNLEDTIFKTNMEAASTLVRQLKLRNLGGIIIIDFIDMQDLEHQKQVYQHLDKNLKQDSAKTNISQVSELGLVEMTRQRTRESLQNILCEPCKACAGKGL